MPDWEQWARRLGQSLDQGAAPAAEENTVGQDACAGPGDDDLRQKIREAVQEARRFVAGGRGAEEAELGGLTPPATGPRPQSDGGADQERNLGQEAGRGGHDR